MTQFALARTSNNCSNLKLVEELQDDFLMGVADNLFPDSSMGKIFALEVDGVNIDSLMLNAQKMVIESLEFEESELCGIIVEVAQVVDELIFWYGSDYDELEYVYDIPTLLSKIEEAIGDSSCELYIHYKKSK